MASDPKCGSPSREGAQSVLVKNSLTCPKFSKNGRDYLNMKNRMNTTAAVGTAVTHRRNPRPSLPKSIFAAQLCLSIISPFPARPRPASAVVAFICPGSLLSWPAPYSATGT